MGNQLAKKETTFTGLYDHCEWDVKVVRKQILSKKLAPISVGRAEEGKTFEECPICFLVSAQARLHATCLILLRPELTHVSTKYYTGGLNRSKCCRKGTCTGNALSVRTCALM